MLVLVIKSISLDICFMLIEESKEIKVYVVYLVDIFHLHVAPQYRDFGTIVRNSEALDRVDFIRTAF